MADVNSVEKTKAQTVGGTVMCSKSAPLRRYSAPESPATYRKMRKDPTIALARWLAAAPVIYSDWSIQEKAGAPDGAKEFIEAELLPLRLHTLRSAMYGQIDFGWQAFEKVLISRGNGTIGVRKLKPLLQDITTILIDENTGAFAGLKQGEVTLQVADSLLFSFEPEGTDWYGNSIMEIARDPYNKWNTVESAAARYDAKIAGTFFVVYYPVGESMFRGKMVDNAEIARTLVDEADSSGSMTIPWKVQATIEDLNKDTPEAWKIELLSDNSAGRGAFTERQKYLDSLKVRSFGLPERAVLEGQYGTLAEAEAHGDFAIINMELRHQEIVQVLNWHLVNHLLRITFRSFAENSVYLVPAPISDAGKAFLRDVYKTLLANPDAFLLESEQLDTASLRQSIGIPSKPDDQVLPATLPAAEPPQGEFPNPSTIPVVVPAGA